jgi:hypothetical protein
MLLRVQLRSGDLRTLAQARDLEGAEKRRLLEAMPSLGLAVLAIAAALAWGSLKTTGETA